MNFFQMYDKYSISVHISFIFRFYITIFTFLCIFLHIRQKR